jgi:hypothetical protein
MAYASNLVRLQRVGRADAWLDYTEGEVWPNYIKWRSGGVWLHRSEGEVWIYIYMCVCVGEWRAGLREQWVGGRVTERTVRLHCLLTCLPA